MYDKNDVSSSLDDLFEHTYYNWDAKMLASKARWSEAATRSTMFGPDAVEKYRTGAVSTHPSVPSASLSANPSLTIAFRWSARSIRPILKTMHRFPVDPTAKITVFSFDENAWTKMICKPLRLPNKENFRHT